MDKMASCEHVKTVVAPTILQRSMHVGCSMQAGASPFTKCGRSTLHAPRSTHLLAGVAAEADIARIELPPLLQRTPHHCGAAALLAARCCLCQILFGSIGKHLHAVYV